MFALCVPSGRTVSFDPRRVYVDTNVFIEFVERQGEVSEALARLFGEASQGSLSAVTSDLTLAEILVKPKRERDDTLARTYIDLLVLSRLVSLIPVSRDILLETADYRANTRQQDVPGADRRNFLPDAIHVVTAIRAGCGTFLARDARIRLPSEIRRLSPDAPSLTRFLAETP